MKKTIPIFLIVLCAVVLLFAALFMFDLIRLIDLEIPSEVSSIQVTDTLNTGETIEIKDIHTIQEITALIDKIGPCFGVRSSKNGSHYSICLLDSDGEEILQLTIVSENEISMGNHFTRTDASSLIAYLNAYFSSN